MPAFARHLFVCGNARPADHPRGCCDAAGAGALHQAFKHAVADRGLQRTVRANKAGCLDQCEHGPTVVVYPEGVWYGPVTAATWPRSSTGISCTANRSRACDWPTPASTPALARTSRGVLPACSRDHTPPWTRFSPATT